MTSEFLYFGTVIPAGGSVSAEAWKAFVNETVTPRFPAGLTVVQGSGQWQSASGPIISEASYILNIVHAGTAREQKALAEIVRIYKDKFKHEAVLRLSAPACAGF